MPAKKVSGVTRGRVPRKTTGRTQAAVSSEPSLAPRRSDDIELIPNPPYGYIQVATQANLVERGSPKGPTSEQWTAMAGAMYNALERLRNCSAMWKRKADENQGWLQPGHVMEVTAELDAATNVLRVGLKARFQRETPRAS